MCLIKKHWLLLIVLLATIIAYSNTLYADYQFDDLRVILNDGFIKDFSNFEKFSTWTNNILRPLSLFTLALNYKVHGVSIGGFHFINILIHIANIILLYAITHKLNQTCTLGWNKYLLCLPALIFALHPIQTQAVTYLVQRMTSQSVLFYLLSLVFYFGYRKSIKQNSYLKITVFSVLILTSIVASFLSKQIGITACLTILGFETFLFANRKKLKTLIIPILGFSLLTSVVAYTSFTGNLPKTRIDYSRFDYFIAQVNALPIYFKLLSTGIGLNIDHYKNINDTSLFSTIFGVTVYIMSISALFFRTNKFIKTTIVFFIASMLIESTIIPIKDIIVDHRMYLPIIPISLFLTYYLNKSIRANSNTSFFTMSLLALTVTLGTSTFIRNRIWENKLTLWTSSVEVNPTNTRALNNLAQAHMLEGDFDKAKDILKEAIFITPDHTILHSNISICYAYIDEFSNAEIHLNKLRQLSRDKAKLNYTEAVIQIRKKETEKAETLLHKVLKNNKRHYLAHEKLIEIYGMKLEREKKDKQIQILRQLNPEYFVIKEKMHLSF